MIRPEDPEGFLGGSAIERDRLGNLAAKPQDQPAVRQGRDVIRVFRAEGAADSVLEFDRQGFGLGHVAAIDGEQAKFPDRAEDRGIVGRQRPAPSGQGFAEDWLGLVSTSQTSKQRTEMIIGLEGLGGIATERISRQLPVVLQERLGLAGLPSCIEQSGEHRGDMDGGWVRWTEERSVELQGLDELGFGALMLAERGVSGAERLTDRRLNLGFVVKVADNPRGGPVEDFAEAGVAGTGIEVGRGFTEDAFGEEAGRLSRGPVAPLGLLPFPGHQAHPDDDRGHERRRQSGRYRMATTPEPDTGDRADRPRRDRLAREPTSEIFGQTSGVGIAVRRFLFEAFQADQFEVAGDQAIGLGRRLGNGRTDEVDGLEQGRPGQRRAASQQRIKDGTEAVDVRGGGELIMISPGLFGRHVRRGADEHARPGLLTVAVQSIGDAEVGDVRLAFGVDQDVRRFEVAVQDSSGMCVMDRFRDGREERGGPSRIGEVIPQSAVEAPAGDQLHGEKVVAPALADLINRHDVGVVHPCDHLGLVVEAGQLRFRGVSEIPEDLEGHRPVERDLPSLVDKPHPATAEQRNQLVSRLEKRLADVILENRDRNQFADTRVDAGGISVLVLGRVDLLGRDELGFR